jgi:hypothetical protein
VSVIFAHYFFNASGLHGTAFFTKESKKAVVETSMVSIWSTICFSNRSYLELFG